MCEVTHHYASLIVLVYDDTLNKYVVESLNSIGQWDWKSVTFKPVTPKLKQIEAGQSQPKTQSPVSGPICSHRASVTVVSVLSCSRCTSFVTIGYVNHGNVLCA